MYKSAQACKLPSEDEQCPTTPHRPLDNHDIMPDAPERAWIFFFLPITSNATVAILPIRKPLSSICR